MSQRVVETTAPARVHLAGNPSDGYGGAVLSCTLDAFAATVSLAAADAISVHGPARHWASVDALVDDVSRRGHEGGDRLVTAALATAARHVGPIASRSEPFAVDWSTTIPQSVGLAGSSAIVLATIDAALAWWEVELDASTRARLALAAETDELGLGAGIADRFAQAIGGVVLTDARGDEASAHEVAVGRSLTVAVCWRADLAAPSGRYHADLRRSIDAAERAALDGVAHLGELADRAAAAVRAGDIDALARAADDSLTTRIAMGSVDPALIAAAEQLRTSGAGVNFAGSGGAFVVVAREPGDPSADLVADGWTVVPVALEVHR